MNRPLPPEHRRHVVALMAYVLQGSETSPTVEDSFEMANRLADFAESGESRKTTALPKGAALTIDADCDRPWASDD